MQNNTTTVSLLYELYGYDLKMWKQRLAAEQYKYMKSINKSRIPLLLDLEQLYEGKYSNIPYLDRELMRKFHDSQFAQESKAAAEAMVGYTIERIRTTSGEEQTKHINDLQIHNIFMRGVVDHFKN